MQRECAAAADQVDESFEREASSPVFARLRSIAAGRSASCCAAAGDPGKKKGVLLTHLPPTISHSHLRLYLIIPKISAEN